MLETESREGVVLVRMVRGKGNSLSLDFVQALHAALDRLAADESRAVILTGHGRVFSAGVDLPAILQGDVPYARAFLPAMLAMFERLATFPKPVVAACNGHALAGGAIMLLAADQRLVARGPYLIGLTEARVGVQFPAWALEVARFALPAPHFATAVCTGRAWPAEEAFLRGFGDELLAAGEVLPRAWQVAAELAEIHPVSFAATKAAARRTLVEAATAGAAREDAAVIETWCSSAVRERIQAFVSRAIRRKE